MSSIKNDEKRGHGNNEKGGGYNRKMKKGVANDELYEITQLVSPAAVSGPYKTDKWGFR